MPLLRGHIGFSSLGELGAQGLFHMDRSRDAKITERNLVFGSQKHVLRFHITMDDLLTMRIVESRGNLFGIENDCCKRKWDASGMSLQHCAIESMVHPQKGSCVFDAKVENTHE